MRATAVITRGRRRHSSSTRRPALRLRRNVQRHHAGVRDDSRIRQSRRHSRDQQEAALPLSSEKRLDFELGAVAECSLRFRSHRSAPRHGLCSRTFWCKGAGRRSFMSRLITKRGSGCVRRIFVFTDTLCIVPPTSLGNQDYHQHDSGAIGADQLFQEGRRSRRIITGETERILWLCRRRHRRFPRPTASPF